MMDPMSQSFLFDGKMVLIWIWGATLLVVFLLSLWFSVRVRISVFHSTKRRAAQIEESMLYRPGLAEYGTYAAFKISERSNRLNAHGARIQFFINGISASVFMSQGAPLTCCSALHSAAWLAIARDPTDAWQRNRVECRPRLETCAGLRLT